MRTGILAAVLALLASGPAWGQGYAPYPPQYPAWQPPPVMMQRLQPTPLQPMPQSFIPDLPRPKLLGWPPPGAVPFASGSQAPGQAPATDENVVTPTAGQPD